MEQLFTHVTLFDGVSLRRNMCLQTTNGLISGIYPEGAPQARGEEMDMAGKIISPPLIDLQIYGGNGRLFNNDPSVETIAATWEAVKAGGGGHFQITLSSSPLELMWQAIEACKTYQAQGGAGLLGLHLEGPYFNPEKRGAHPLEFIRKPHPEEIQELLKRGKGVVTYMTIAPEMFDNDTLQLLLQSDIALSAGHSNATYEEAMDGFEQGISRATHLFNAMSPFQGRLPGMVGAIYEAKPLTSIIADGVHCDFASVRISQQILGERLFLITDAVTTSESGHYRFTEKDGRYVDTTGTLAGSGLTMWQAVKNMVQQVGIPLEEALRMATTYPAQAYGRNPELGKLKTGAPAKWVVFDEDLHELICLS